MTLIPKGAPKVKVGTVRKLLDREKKLAQRTRHVMKVSVGLSEAEYQRVLEYAEQVGMTLAEVVRSCLFRGLSHYEQWGTGEPQSPLDRPVQAPPAFTQPYFVPQQSVGVIESPPQPFSGQTHPQGIVTRTAEVAWSRVQAQQRARNIPGMPSAGGSVPTAQEVVGDILEDLGDEPQGLVDE